MKKALLIIFSIFPLLFYSCGSEEKNVSYPTEHENVIPRPEFPRPDMERKEWVNLNGEWDFKFDPNNEGVSEKWFINTSKIDRKVLVPFPWQSILSRVGKEPPSLDQYPFHLLPVRERNKIAWYHRNFLTPPWIANGKRVFLVFGAVDWRADIWLNGYYIGYHEGGYTPFSIDITDYLLPEGFRNSLVVRVYDPGSSDEELIPVGKQGDLWYTPSSGIWQTVYLEARGDVYFKNYRVKTDINTGTIFLKGNVLSEEKDAELYETCLDVYDDSGTKYKGCWKVYIFPGENKIIRSVTLSQFQLWSPDNPHLYYFRWDIEKSGKEIDSFKGYFGIREIKIDWAPGHSPKDTSDPLQQYKYIYLNGKPVYIRGVLDQGYNPWGIYTYPSVNTIETQLNYVKSLGFNTIRIHIKGPDPYKLYLADKLGLFVIYDMPSLKMSANGEDPVGQRNYLLTVKGLMERDVNHPSILWWTMFNEDWGLLVPSRLKYNPDLQEWVKEVVDFARSIDPFRPVEDNSAGGLGAFDHLYTDIQSWHFYIRNYQQLQQHLKWIVNNTYPGSTQIWVPGYIQNGQPLINSEFNGLDVYSGDKDISWYLHWQVNLMRMFPKIQGYVFTQLTDVEYEHNGLLRYNGVPKDLGYEMMGITTDQLNSDLYLSLDVPPVISAKPGEKINVPLYFSNFTDKERNLKIEYTINGWNATGNRTITGWSSPIIFSVSPFSVKSLGSLTIRVPDFLFAGTVLFRVLNDNNEIISSNFFNIFVNTVCTGNCVDIDPGKFSSEKWDAGFVADRDFFYGRGRGNVEYVTSLPASITTATSITFLLELSSGGIALANRETSNDLYFSDVTLDVNGVKVSGFHVGEYADSTGFLSYLNDIHLAGSHGKFVRILVTDKKILNSIKSSKELNMRFYSDNGLKIFGKTLGSYPWGIRILW